jgi:hypothetical protein
MSQSPDNLSRFVFKTDTSADKLQNLTGALAKGEGADGAVFAPMEAFAAGMREGNALFQMLKIACLLLARGIIAPVELLLRRRFGERYFNGLVFAAVIACYFFARFFMNVNEGYCHTVLIVFVAGVSVNGWMCFIRDRKGDYWHSYSEGESWIRVRKWDEFFAQWNFTFDVSKLFIEPVAVILAGVVCLIFPNDSISLGFEGVRMNPFALYFLVAGVVLFIYQLYCYFYRRNMLHDEKDAGVIAELCAMAQGSTLKPGISEHKGVTYVSLGGKNEWKK